MQPFERNGLADDGGKARDQVVERRSVRHEAANRRQHSRGVRWEHGDGPQYKRLSGPRLRGDGGEETSSPWPLPSGACATRKRSRARRAAGAHIPEACPLPPDAVRRDRRLTESSPAAALPAPRGNRVRFARVESGPDGRGGLTPAPGTPRRHRCSLTSRVTTEANRRTPPASRHVKRPRSCSFRRLPTRDEPATYVRDGPDVGLGGGHSSFEHRALHQFEALLRRRPSMHGPLYFTICHSETLGVSHLITTS